MPVTFPEYYRRSVVLLVRLMAALAAAGILAMIVATCIDIVMRQLGQPMLGVVDIVQLTACVSGICALPYTTAVKGHVAVEFFFQRLPVAWRPWLDGLARLLIAVMFAFLAWRSWLYGNYMQEHDIGTMTLQLPMHWVMRLMSFSFAVTVLVKFQHLLHPGKEMMKS